MTCSRVRGRSASSAFRSRGVRRLAAEATQKMQRSDSCGISPVQRMRPYRRHGRFIGLWNRRQAAKETVRLVLHSCRKVDLVGIAAGIASAGNKRPEIADGDRGTVGAFQLAQEMIILRIEDIDRTVTKIPNEKIVGELAKSRRCDRKSPGRIKHPAGCHSVQQ